VLCARPRVVSLTRVACVREALAAGASWVWFIDDDHIFAHSTLLRLLRHNVDIVVPLVVGRHPPHLPLLFSHFEVRSDMTDDELVAACRVAHASGSGLDLKFQDRGLVEMGRAATAGMLISAHVLRALPDPWFEFGRLGTTEPAGEDTWFCLCARRAGFRVWCDLDTPIGHLMTAALWPSPDLAFGDTEPLIEFAFDIPTLTAHER
jgi:hypothetical protein